jgi:outer membrane lipoprotein-sorting protein
MIARLLLISLLIFAGTSIAQDKVTFHFNNVQTAVYDYNIESFQDSGNYDSAGQIQIHFDKKAVVIDCPNDENDKELSIIEKNEEVQQGEMYICAMDGQYYAFTVSEDQSELTLVSADHRFVYKIKN